MSRHSHAFNTNGYLPFHVRQVGINYGAFSIKIDKSILTAKESDISRVAFTFYEVPTRDTAMHRIIQGPDTNMWFTEMMSDKVGKHVTRRSMP